MTAPQVIALVVGCFFAGGFGSVFGLYAVALVAAAREVKT